jgi:hypothetical protein
MFHLANQGSGNFLSNLTGGSQAEQKLCRKKKKLGFRGVREK